MLNQSARTWSTAKSIAATLFGVLVDQCQLSLDKPLGFDWLPRVRGESKDPRSAITLRHVLNMSSGLGTVDNGDLELRDGIRHGRAASDVRPGGDCKAVGR